MALIVVQATDGRSILVHSSIFDRQPPRPTPAEREAAWRAAWAQFEQARLDSADTVSARLSAMTKHPRDMTEAELGSLPTVNRFAGDAERTFEGHGGSRWAVGRSGSIWVKARVSAPSERPP